MTRTGILEKLQTIFIDFFDNKDLCITEDTSMENLEEWDSVEHIQIVLEIETEFEIMFEADDIGKMTNIKEIINKIEIARGQS